MRKLCIVVSAFLTLLAASSFADAGLGSAFGTLTTARTGGQGSGYFGLGVGIADLTSVTGSFTYGLSTHTDGRIKLALVDDEAIDASFAIGADFKYHMIDTTNSPIDLALGGFGEYYSFDNLSVFELGAQILGSRPFALRGGSVLEPYGRFNVRVEMLSLDNVPPGFDDSENNIEFGLNAGVRWGISRSINLFGEFQFDGNDGVFFGIDFNTM